MRLRVAMAFTGHTSSLYLHCIPNHNYTLNLKSPLERNLQLSRVFNTRMRVLIGPEIRQNVGFRKDRVNLHDCSAIGTINVAHVALQAILR
jgi:hypothetical protein